MIKTKFIATIDISTEGIGFKEIQIERYWRVTGENGVFVWRAYNGFSRSSLRRCQRAQLRLLGDDVAIFKATP